MKNGNAPEPRSKLAVFGTVVLFCGATIGAVQFMRPSEMLPTAPLTKLAEAIAPPLALAASPAASAFGLSGGVNVRFALPGQPLQYVRA